MSSKRSRQDEPVLPMPSAVTIATITSAMSATGARGSAARCAKISFISSPILELADVLPAEPRENWPISLSSATQSSSPAVRRVAPDVPDEVLRRAHREAPREVDVLLDDHVVAELLHEPDVEDGDVAVVEQHHVAGCRSACTKPSSKHILRKTGCRRLRERAVVAAAAERRAACRGGTSSSPRAAAESSGSDLGEVGTPSASAKRRGSARWCRGLER